MIVLKASRVLPIFILLLFPILFFIFFSKHFSLFESQQENEQTNYVNPYIESLSHSPKIGRMKQFCDNLCNAIKTATDYKDKLEAMASWCFTKITDYGKDFIDIVLDGRPGFFVVGGLPYCEDGVYCFHFFNCEADITIGFEECRKILCKYYTEVLGLSTSEASKFIKEKIITPGKCVVDERLVSNVALVHSSPNWWYERFFEVRDEDGNLIEDFCSVLVKEKIAK